MRVLISLPLLAVSFAANALHTWVDEHGQRHVSTVPAACIDAGRLARGCAPATTSAEYKARLRAEQAEAERLARYDELSRERDRRARALRREQRDLHDADTELADIPPLHAALSDYLEADRRLDPYRDEYARRAARAAREELRLQLYDAIDRVEAQLREQAFEAERRAALRRTEAAIRAEERRRTRLLALHLFSSKHRKAARRPSAHRHAPHKHSAEPRFPHRPSAHPRRAPTHGKPRAAAFERLQRSDALDDTAHRFDRIRRFRSSLRNN